jgi:hypothetical protein
MRIRWRGLTLSVAVSLLVLVRPVSSQQIPPGYELLSDPRVSGALLVETRPDSGGASALMRKVSASCVLFPVMPTRVGPAAGSNRMRAGGEL